MLAKNDKLTDTKAQHIQSDMQQREYDMKQIKKHIEPGLYAALKTYLLCNLSKFFNPSQHQFRHL
jgi:hypothetical protein